MRARTSPAARPGPVLPGHAFEVETPAFVYDEPGLDRACRQVAAAAAGSGCRALFAVKAFSAAGALARMVPPLAGFAVSSLFEARLAREACGRRGTLHLTTPGLRETDVEPLADLCDHVAFNSLGHLERFGPRVRGRARIGLRVNPQRSRIEDPRYDPCRPHSKLGVPLDRVETVLAGEPGLLHAVEGLHVHGACDAEHFDGLLETADRLAARIPALLDRVAWVNLGGGYPYAGPGATSALREAAARLRNGRDLEILVEPGAAIAREAGSLVASVIDLFDSEGREVAVLDTSVNHLPEVFEYQYAPDALGDHEDGRHVYLLAGATCLAGDLFGEYGFDHPLEVGSRVVFPDAGAYSLVKAHAFNGVALPTVYALDEAGRLSRGHVHDYDEFARRWDAGRGDDADADAA